MLTAANTVFNTLGLNSIFDTLFPIKCMLYTKGWRVISLERLKASCKVIWPHHRPDLCLINDTEIVLYVYLLVAGCVFRLQRENDMLIDLLSSFQTFILSINGREIEREKGRDKKNLFSSWNMNVNAHSMCIWIHIIFYSDFGIHNKVLDTKVGKLIRKFSHHLSIGMVFRKLPQTTI